MTFEGCGPYVHAMLPEGFGARARSLVPPMPDIPRCMRRVIERTYRGLPLPNPQQFQHLSQEDRNQEIYHRYIAGERTADLAKEFRISVRRVNRLIRRYFDRGHE